MDLLAQGMGYSEPASSIAGAVFGVAFLAGGLLTLRLARYLRSMPPEQRELQPRFFSASFYLEHPGVTRGVGIGMILVGSVVLAGILARIGMYGLGIDPPY